MLVGKVELFYIRNESNGSTQQWRYGSNSNDTNNSNTSGDGDGDGDGDGGDDCVYKGGSRFAVEYVTGSTYIYIYI